MGKSSGMTLGEIAERLALTCAGDASLTITGLGTLAGAGPGDLSFLANPRYQKQLAETNAGAVILHRDMAGVTDLPALLADDPYLAFARATALFDTAPRLSGIHERAVVATSADLGESVAVGANAVIGDGAVVGEGSVIHPGAVIGPNVRIGARCVIFANVSIYHDVRIGNDVRVHSGAVIGGDGFGFAPNQGAWTKVYQLGSVVIGDRVEIGAGSTIDRGALDDTVIGNDVILDSQVIIAHNVVVGDGTAFAGRAAVAGSAVIGRNCTIAGGAGIVGHIELADGVHVSACALVTKSILEPGASVSSGTPLMSTADWRKSAVRFSQLETLNRRLSKLEKRVKSQRDAD